MTIPVSPTIKRAGMLEIIPSIDLIDGRVVRLRQGDFATKREYGDPVETVLAWRAPEGTRLHVVDLSGSRDGSPVETATVARLRDCGMVIQVGGGIRSLVDARRWIDAGAARVVIGTALAKSPQTVREIVAELGAARVIASVDVRHGKARVSGWEQSAASSPRELLQFAEDLGIREAIVTEIERDGTLQGPALDLYRTLSRTSRLRIIASGGAGQLGDVVALARRGHATGVVLGRALHDGRFTLHEAISRVATARAIPERIVPCLDVRAGRVVKGVQFRDLRDAGDPVALALRYQQEGADELVVLDIAATAEERAASIEMVRAIANELFIPLTVGGGVRSIEDVRELIRAGADRVAINTAAIRDPDLLARVAAEFGVQALVLSCDARKRDAGFEVVVRAGGEGTGLDAADWCARAESLGAGEILLTSIDRDGTAAGFDLELLRAVTSRVRIGVIASGGAGTLAHFREAIESGGARAVLAASLFHDNVLTISEVKEYLNGFGIPVRR